MNWNLQATTAPATHVNPAHPHCAFVDENGNGRTSVDAGHWHQIAGGRILPDLRDRHGHDIPQPAIPCQAMAGPPQGAAPAPGTPGCGPCTKNRQ
jgi:hypothetical protein